MRTTASTKARTTASTKARTTASTNPGQAARDQRPAIGLLLATSTGGVGAHVRSLAAGLPAYGFDVTVAGPPSTEALFGFRATGARFVPTSGRLDVSAVRSLGVDVVHAHGLRAAVLAGLGRGPCVATWHNAVLAGEHSRGARLALVGGEWFAARRADVTLAASADLAARARSLGARDVREVPVALDSPPPVRSPQQVRVEFGLQDEALVLCVARLHPQKGLDVLVDAAVGWREVVVVVAGDGPLREELAARIRRSGAPVRLLGRRTDVADLLGAADLAVLPSRWEARSLFAQESARAGVPLVATAVGGMPELLADAARLVPPDDVVALAQAVAGLLADPAARRELAVRATARAATWPTEADSIAAVAAVYRELLAP